MTGLAFLTFFVFNLLYSIGDIRVFYIPAYLIWAIWSGLGVSAVAWLLLYRDIENPWRRGLALLVCCAVLALPVWLFSHHVAHVDQSRNDHAAQFWQNILGNPIPQGAILVSNDRDEMTPLWYLQYVKNQRPDLTGLFPVD